jgi:hypothetical protein
MGHSGLRPLDRQAFFNGIQTLLDALDGCPDVGRRWILIADGAEHFQEPPITLRAFGFSA